MAVAATVGQDSYGWAAARGENAQRVAACWLLRGARNRPSKTGSLSPGGPSGDRIPHCLRCVEGHHTITLDKFLNPV